MEGHFPDPDVELVTALDFGNSAGGLAGIGERSAAGRRPLRIAELRFLKPGSGLEQSEMRKAQGRQHQQQAAAQQNAKRSHVISPVTSLPRLNPLEPVQKRGIDTSREMGHQLVAGPHRQPAGARRERSSMGNRRPQQSRNEPRERKTNQDDADARGLGSNKELNHPKEDSV